MLRETLPDGAVRLSHEDCSFTYRRPRPGIVVVHIAGMDRGLLGTAPTDEFREDVSRYAPVELFVDTTEVTTPSVPVQDMWSEWFRDNRGALKSVSILARGNYMHFTMEVAKLFSRTGELIRVYLDPVAFHEALERAAPGASLPGRPSPRDATPRG
jgi:hypothetical protein